MGSPSTIPGDDPRQIREHLLRSCDLATSHGLPSVVVGLAGPEGDLGVPEFLTFVQSALRVEDAIFRLTRERAVLFLADVNRDQAAEIVQRLASDFAGRFPAVAEPDLVVGTFEVQPGQRTLLVKDVLPAVFPPRSRGPAN
jgi:hypothetical protein